MKNEKKDKFERRFLPIAQSGLKVEQRADGKGNVISGLAAVTNQLSVNLGGFRERNAPGWTRTALTEELLTGDEDPKSLFNHNQDLILGRTQNKTLELEEVDGGLSSRTYLIDTTHGENCRKDVQHGNITQMSYAFTVLDEVWEVIEWENIRTIILLKRIFDTSPVTYPAFPQTSISARQGLLGRTEMDFDRLLRAKIRAEHDLPATKDDVQALRDAAQDLGKLINHVEERCGKRDGVQPSKSEFQFLTTLEELDAEIELLRA